MAPKRGHARDSAATTASTTGSSASSVATSTSKPTRPSASAQQDQGWDKVVINLWSHYLQSTPQRTKLIDVFMAFLGVVGALQFVYCVLAGNYVRRVSALDTVVISC